MFFGNEKGKLFTNAILVVTILEITIGIALGMNIMDNTLETSAKFVKTAKKEVEDIETVVQQIEEIERQINIDNLEELKKETDVVLKDIIEKVNDVNEDKKVGALTIVIEPEVEVSEKKQVEPVKQEDKKETNNVQQEVIDADKGDIIGRIQIPKTGVDYSIYKRVSPQILEKGMAMQYGPGLNIVGNTIIMGHNYQNGQLFSNNPKLVNGDKIEITDEFGNKVIYSVYDKYYVSDKDTSYYKRDVAGKREITLLCCADDDVRKNCGSSERNLMIKSYFLICFQLLVFEILFQTRSFFVILQFWCKGNSYCLSNIVGLSVFHNTYHQKM